MTKYWVVRKDTRCRWHPVKGEQPPAGYSYFLVPSDSLKDARERARVENLAILLYKSKWS